MSVDGFIAKPDGGVDWLDPGPAKHCGDGQFVATIGRIVMGHATYGQIIGFGNRPYAGTQTYILTARPFDLARPQAAAVPDWPGLVVRLDPQTGGDLWGLGGGRSVARPWRGRSA